MSTTLGNYSEPAWGGMQVYSGGMTQMALLVTAPSSGRIVKLGAWLAGWSGAVTAELAIWDKATGAVLAHSASFTAAEGGNGSPPHVAVVSGWTPPCTFVARAPGYRQRR